MSSSWKHNSQRGHESTFRRAGRRVELPSRRPGDVTSERHNPGDSQSPSGIIRKNSSPDWCWLIEMELARARVCHASPFHKLLGYRPQATWILRADSVVAIAWRTVNHTKVINLIAARLKLQAAMMGFMPELAFSPEFRFLLRCCSVSDASRQPLTAQELEHLDWASVSELAEKHGVIPHVFTVVSSVPNFTPPDMLSSAFSANTKRSLWFAAELLRVSRSLSNRGIETLAYKGPALAQLLYGDVSTRQYNDLDFLIRTEDVTAAKTTLLDFGYHTREELTPRQEREYLKSGYEYAFDHPQGRNLLELHWQVQSRFYAMDFCIEDFFHRAISIQVSSQTVRTLCPEDLLLVLCAHAAKHLWMRLSLLCDIARLSRSPALNWQDVQKESVRLGLQRIVAVSFLLANKLIDCPIPEWITNDDATNATVQEIIRILVSDDEYDVESAGYFRLMLRLRERYRDRASLLWRLTTTPSMGEWKAVNLPDTLFPLYRVIRVGRLAQRFALHRR